MKSFRLNDRLPTCLFLALIFVLLLSLLCGCGAKGNDPPAAAPPSMQEASAAAESPTAAEPSSVDAPAQPEEPQTEDAHILVAYFSATGHTAPIAEAAAELLNADLYKIVPEEPYTEADLAYFTGGRCDREQDDPDVRPAIAGSVGNMEQYDLVLIGHPIWHGQAPRIISTFLESYDFSGKTLVTFCTSASSPLGSSASDLYALVPDSVTWLESRRFPIGAPEEDVAEWLREIGLMESSISEQKRQIRIDAGGQTKTATLSDNASAEAFYALLTEGPVTIEMHDYGGFEKVGPLGTSLIRSDESITTSPGDVILYQGDQITIYYDVNTWDFTLLGHIDGATAEEMRAFLVEDDTTVTFSIPN